MTKTAFKKSIPQGAVVASGFALALAFAGCTRDKDAVLKEPGGSVSSVTLTVPQIDTSNSPENKIFVSVADQGGSFITDFLLGNFSIVEGGTPSVPTKVYRSEDVLWVVIVLDKSGSMTLPTNLATTRMFEAIAGAKALVNALGDQDRCAVITFSSSIDTLVNFTTDKAALTSQLDTVTPGGGTPLRDATVRGAEMLSGISGRQLLVVLTDGDDQGSVLYGTPEQVAFHVNIKGASANMIGIGDTLSADGTAALTTIATETGGQAIFATSGSGLSPILLEILNRYNNLVAVEYRRRAGGTGTKVNVYLNYGALTAQGSKSL
jgi:hypothetical protein